MAKKQPTQEQFLKDVAKHQMSIKLDQGVYRHIVFQQPEHGYVHRFEIVTTPWRLMITGDMGTWVFARLEDMFEFFRTDNGKINRCYWAEKLLNGTHGCSDAAKVYDGDTYKARVLESLDDYGLSTARKRAIRRELQQRDFDDEHWIISQLRDFSLDGFQFQDIWEIDMKTYSYHFVWCCYAIAWAIQEYDAAKAEAKPGTPEAMGATCSKTT